MTTIADASAIVDLINRRHGTTLRPVEPSASGESSPWIVRDHSGVRHLLKWGDGSEFRIGQATEIVERLTRLGYPIPPYLVTGRAGSLAYSVRRLIPGRAMTRPQHLLNPRYLPRLLKLNDLQADAAHGLKGDFRARILESVLVGLDRFCVHETLRSYSAQTAAMLARLQALAKGLANLSLPATDAVHGDFNGANILVDKRRIVAVIDWEGATAGDRAFDLATLLFYDYLNPPVREALSARLVRIAPSEAIALYLAHLVIRQVDWSIRHHRQPVIKHYLRVASEILRGFPS